jgi:hypothetical protein
MQIERALGLLGAAKDRELSVKEAVELIELVTKTRVKDVLAEAEERGVIKREGKHVMAACDSNCMRCGKAITACYFISFYDDEIGPFGGGCIQKLRLDK